MVWKMEQNRGTLQCRKIFVINLCILKLIKLNNTLFRIGEPLSKPEWAGNSVPAGHFINKYTWKYIT